MECCVKKPNEQVAEKIIESFQAESLLSKDSLRKVLDKLSSGAINASDWRVMFEKELSTPEEEDKK
jgi:hypothetical protein